MPEIIQATKWQAQLYDGKKYYGGKLNDIQCVNVAIIDPSEIKVFTISHNTFAHTFYDPWQKWYGVTGEYQYPQQYRLEDGSILTVDYDPVTQDLVLLQV